MAYLGNSLSVQQYAPQVAYFSGNGTATSFTLPSAVVSAAQIIVSVNNVVQNPQYAYTVSGTTLTFTSAPPANSTTPNNIWVEYTSLQTNLIQPAAGTVNTAQLGTITNIQSGNSALSLQTGSTPTTAVYVDTSQNVGIGTTTISAPNGRVYNLQIGTNNSDSTSELLLGHQGDGFSLFTSGGSGAGALSFSQGTSEKMRIDTSGNLLVGTTSVLVASNPAPVLNVVGGGSNYATMYQRNTATSAGKFWRSGVDAGNSWNVYNQSNVGVYVADGATSWSATSDETKKENLIPIFDALTKVVSLRSVIGNYIDDPEKINHPFLIAQDVQKVLPEAVNEKDGVLGLQYTDIIPLLVASIKELNAKVDAQAATITALQAKVGV